MKADYEIRQETEKDYPQVFKLVEEAFRDMEESDHREQFLVERLRHSPAFVPELSLVADGDGGVVGYGLCRFVREYWMRNPWRWLPWPYGRTGNPWA